MACGETKEKGSLGEVGNGSTDKEGGYLKTDVSLYLLPSSSILTFTKATYPSLCSHGD